MAFNEGETADFEAIFRDEDGNKTDPGTPVEISLRTPNGTLEGPFTMQKESTGVFSHRDDLNAQGIYNWKVETADGFVEQGEAIDVMEDI